MNLSSNQPEPSRLSDRHQPSKSLPAIVDRVGIELELDASDELRHRVSSLLTASDHERVAGPWAGRVFTNVPRSRMGRAAGESSSRLEVLRRLAEARRRR